MADFVRGGTPVTPFGENVWLSSTKAVKTKPYTVARSTVPQAVIDGVPGQRILQKGAVLAKITSGPEAGKVGPFQAAGTAEIQTLTPTTVTAGTFTITVNPVTSVSRTTAPIAWNATAAVIQAAIEALDNVDTGDVLAAGGPMNSTPVTLTFYGQFIGNPAQVTISNTALTGTIAPTTTTAGVAGAADGRQTLANIVGINNTWLPWTLMERDCEVAAAFDATGVQAWCMELDASGTWVTLTNTTRDAMRAGGAAGLITQINFY
jgi:hypothetical protein